MSDTKLTDTISQKPEARELSLQGGRKDWSALMQLLAPEGSEVAPSNNIYAAGLINPRDEQRFLDQVNVIRKELDKGTNTDAIKAILSVPGLLEEMMRELPEKRNWYSGLVTFAAAISELKNDQLKGELIKQIIFMNSPYGKEISIQAIPTISDEALRARVISDILEKADSRLVIEPTVRAIASLSSDQHKEVILRKLINDTSKNSSGVKREISEVLASIASDDIKVGLIISCATPEYLYDGAWPNSWGGYSKAMESVKNPLLKDATIEGLLASENHWSKAMGIHLMSSHSNQEKMLDIAVGFSTNINLHACIAGIVPSLPDCEQKYQLLRDLAVHNKGSTTDWLQQKLAITAVSSISDPVARRVILKELFSDQGSCHYAAEIPGLPEDNEIRTELVLAYIQNRDRIAKALHTISADEKKIEVIKSRVDRLSDSAHKADSYEIEDLARAVKTVESEDKRADLILYCIKSPSKSFNNEVLKNLDDFKTTEHFKDLISIRLKETIKPDHITFEYSPVLKLIVNAGTDEERAELVKNISFDNGLPERGNHYVSKALNGISNPELRKELMDNLLNTEYPSAWAVAANSIESLTTDHEKLEYIDKIVSRRSVYDQDTAWLERESEKLQGFMAFPDIRYTHKYYAILAISEIQDVNLRYEAYNNYTSSDDLAVIEGLRASLSSCVAPALSEYLERTRYKEAFKEAWNSLNPDTYSLGMLEGLGLLKKCHEQGLDAGELKNRIFPELNDFSEWLRNEFLTYLDPNSVQLGGNAVLFTVPEERLKRADNAVFDYMVNNAELVSTKLISGNLEELKTEMSGKLREYIRNVWSHYLG